MKLCGLVVLTLLILIAHENVAYSLTIHWGLQEPTEYYTERAATAEQTAAYWPPAQEGAETFRYFTISRERGANEEFNMVMAPLLERTMTLYDMHLQAGGDATRAAFQSFLRRRDSFLVDSFRRLAPKLYFEFMGSQQNQYVLTGITVEVFDFNEYRGGGFANDEYWYDLILLPELGTYHYAINNNLRFTGSGRTELAFFSNNFYKSAGLSPMGVYTINLTFQFLVNGQTLEVKTGQFKIDV